MPSTNSPLWRISVSTTPEAEEAVASLLDRLFGEKPSTYTDAETQQSIVSIFSDKKSAALKRQAVASGLHFITDCGLDIGPGAISIGKVRREDWAHSWKRHFKPFEVRRRLLIKPSWSKRKPRKGQPMVILDPGLSFGTGQHPTTSFCLEQLVAARETDRRQAFLDIGTGSGILAIAAAKLGYDSVEAFDFDPVAVRVALANARRNRVGSRLRIRRRDLTLLPRISRKQYDVICANLIDELLVAERERLANRLQKFGTLVLAGILKTQFARVAQAYQEIGFSLIQERSEREWQSGAFQRGNGQNSPEK
jgi:ribosomal protein L11 methyltransferase